MEDRSTQLTSAFFDSRSHRPMQVANRIAPLRKLLMMRLLPRPCTSAQSSEFNKRSWCLSGSLAGVNGQTAGARTDSARHTHDDPLFVATAIRETPNGSRRPLARMPDSSLRMLRRTRFTTGMIRISDATRSVLAFNGRWDLRREANNIRCNQTSGRIEAIYGDRNRILNPASANFARNSDRV